MPSTVFEDIDAEKQIALDRWVFDKLPLSPEQKAELLRSLARKPEGQQICQTPQD
jgi:hypothetical protein